MELYELSGRYSGYRRTREEVLEAYREMIAEKGIDACGKGLLFVAADYAHAEALALLLEAGAPPLAVDDHGFTALHHLAQQRECRNHLKPVGHVAACTELLLDAKVDYLHRDNDKMACYHYAAHNGLAEMVETLAKRGAKLDLTDNSGRTGIHIACEHVQSVLGSAAYAKKNVERVKAQCEEMVNNRLKPEGMTDEEIAHYIQNNMPINPETSEAKYKDVLDVVEGYFRTVKAFAEGGVDKDKKSGYGLSALDMAMQSGAKKIGAYLSGALTGEADEADEGAIAAGGMTLYQAAERGDVEAINAIAKTGVNLNALKDDDEYQMKYLGAHALGGATALAGACAYLQDKAVAALLANGADPSFKDGNGRTALWYLDSGLKASLHFGIFDEDRIPKIIRDMVSAGMSINETVNNDADTPLILACKSVQTPDYIKRCVKGDMVDTVLALNPDVNAANRFGETALMHACARHFYMMKNAQTTLLERGADTAAADRNGDTALHYAVRGGTGASSATMLLEFGADPVAVNNAGKTALDIATEDGHESLVKLLLSKIKGVYIMDNVFLNACKNGQKGIVEAFVKKGGIDFNKRDPLGNTPLFYAAVKGARDYCQDAAG